MSNASQNLVAMFLIVTSSTVHGSQPAFDSAADSAYNAGWASGSNGGFGWGSGWVINTSTPFVNGQAFVGDSTTNGQGDPEADGDINSPRAPGGRAWGLTAGTATRAFNAPLTTGQTVSIDFDDYGANSTNYDSFVSILAPGGTTVLKLHANVGSDYRIDTATSEIHTGVAETDHGVHLAFTQLASGIEIALTPYVPGSDTTVDTVSYDGQISAIQFVSEVSGFGTPPSFVTPYINNIAINPEPQSVGFAALVGSVALVRRRRR